MRDIDIFIDHHAGRHIGFLEQLIATRAQDGAHGRVEPLEAPAVGQQRIDRQIDRGLFRDHTGDERVEEIFIGFHKIRVFTLMPEAVLAKFGDDIGSAASGDFHLVQRLNGSEPCGPAQTRAVVRRGFFVLRAHGALLNRSLRAISARQAPATSAPLFLSIARLSAWSRFSTVRMPLPSGIPRKDRSIKPRADSLQT